MTGVLELSNPGELGVYEPPVPTARLIANAMGAPLTYLYCEDDHIAALLLGLHQLDNAPRNRAVKEFNARLAEAYAR